MVCIVCRVIHFTPVQIGYFVLILGGFGVFLWKGYPRFPNDYIDAWQKPVGIIVMSACLGSFLLAAFTHPGHITATSLKRFSRWKFDNAVYTKRICATCGILKPARSKHCRVMNQCVSRFDHYCIWLNTAVGERNYRYFLAFLVTHVAMLWYGAVATMTIFAQEASDKRLFEATFFSRRSNARVSASWWIIVQYLMHENYELAMCLMLCVVMGSVLTGFVGYHLYLALTNSSTNESMKWGEAQRARDWMLRRQRMAEAHFNNIHTELMDAKVKLQRKQSDLQALLATGATPSPVTPGAPGGPAAAAAGGPTSRQSDPQELRETVAALQDKVQRLERVKEEMETVRELHVPQGPVLNPYNRGPIQNLLEVLFPLSDRQPVSLPEHPFLFPAGEEDVQVDAGVSKETGEATTEEEDTAARESHLARAASMAGAVRKGSTAAVPAQGKKKGAKKGNKKNR